MTCLWLSRPTLPSDKPVGAQQNFRLASNYAVQNGWLEISENDTIKLTNAGFAEIKSDKNSN
jgi:hypothetical protein